MSEAFYRFVATFPNRLLKKDIRRLETFFIQMGKFHDWWFDHREASKATVMEELEKNYAFVLPYIESLNIPQWDGNALTGKLIWGCHHPDDDGLEHVHAGVQGATIIYSGEQSTFLNMDDLATFFKSQYGAIDARWMSDEFYDIADVMDMEAGNEVVEAILKKPKEELPVFMNIHPLLDAKIAEIMNK